VVYSITNSDLPSVEGDPRPLDDRGADPIRSRTLAALAEPTGVSLAIASTTRSATASTVAPAFRRSRSSTTRSNRSSVAYRNDRLDIVWNVDFRNGLARVRRRTR